jgi:RND family efflux transporter MFP subunit
MYSLLSRKGDLARLAMYRLNPFGSTFFHSCWAATEKLALNGSPIGRRAAAWCVAIALVSGPSDAYCAQASEIPIAPVFAASVQRLTRAFRLTGELKAYQEVDVFSKIPGYLKSIKVDYGDEVRAGQVVATLEIPEQEQDLAKANAAFNLAQLDYQRIKSVVAAQPGLLAQAEVDRAKANADAARAERDRARALADYAQIVAPFNGIISGRYADIGALVLPGTSARGQTMPIVRISDAYRLRLAVEVPESLISKVSLGASAPLSVPSAGKAISVRVARTSGKVNDSTRTMHVEFDVANADRKYTPGEYATLELPVEEVSAAIAVPTQAVERGREPNLWVVNSAGQIEKRPVKLGLETDSYIQISEGLSAGELVIFGNRAAFAPGMKVIPHLTNDTGEAKDR